MLKDRYELLDELGRGGFAVTYRALDHLVGRYVAVKVSTVSLAYEAKVLRALEYVPYISHIYDYFVWDGKEYLVMRLVEGTSLARRTKESDDPVSTEELMQGLPSLVTALDQIHRRGVIHRDISPGNLMLSPDGAIYLLDFESATQPGPGKLKNRQVYAHKGLDAPEHLRSDLQGVQMDIYSLCATITYLLTGSGIPDPEERAAADPLPRILTGSGLTRKQQNALLKGLRPDAEARYPDMASFARDFFEEEILPSGAAGEPRTVCYCAKSDIGAKKVNQDNFMIDGIIPYIDEDCEVEGEIPCDAGGMHMAAISDGVSASCYGELASKAVIQAATHFIVQYRHSANDPENLLKEVLDQINWKIITLGKKIGRTAATLALVLWKDDRYYIAGIGDSAVYLYRKGHIELLTVSHNLAAEKIRRGEPATLADMHTLTAYLGKEGASGGQMAACRTGRIRKGDRFLICSDGIATGLTVDEIGKALGKEPEAAVEQLWKYVKRRKIRDNSTAVVIEFE